MVLILDVEGVSIIFYLMCLLVPDWFLDLLGVVIFEWYFDTLVFDWLHRVSNWLHRVSNKGLLVLT